MTDRELLESIAKDMAEVKNQLKENTDLIKSLMHRTEELDAKYDGLLNTTATRESVERLEAKIDKILATQITQGESINILALRQFQTESEVAALKKAK